MKYFIWILAFASINAQEKNFGPVPQKLQHMKEVKQCSLCHVDKNTLNLLDGVQIPYNESPKLCGQCHGERLREWEDGLHGKQKGGWKTSQTLSPLEKISCVSCHDPHSPRYEPTEPLKPPKNPHFLIRKKENHHE